MHTAVVRAPSPWQPRVAGRQRFRSRRFPRVFFWGRHRRRCGAFRGGSVSNTNPVVFARRINRGRRPRNVRTAAHRLHNNIMRPEIRNDSTE